MPERKSKSIVANMEPTFYDLAVMMAERKRQSTSSYLRTLVLNDLLAAGVLTPDTIVKVTTRSDQSQVA